MPHSEAPSRSRFVLRVNARLVERHFPSGSVGASPPRGPQGLLIVRIIPQEHRMVAAMALLSSAHPLPLPRRTYAMHVMDEQDEAQLSGLQIERKMF